MRTLRLSIAELADRTVTRSRGNLAHSNLLPYLDGNLLIELDISGDHPMSLSFLDEIVRLLAEGASLNQVIFVAEEGSNALRKLSRIADIRQVDLKYLDIGTMETRRAPWLSVARNEVTVVKDKSEVENP